MASASTAGPISIICAAKNDLDGVPDLHGTNDMSDVSDRGCGSPDYFRKKKQEIESRAAGYLSGTTERGIPLYCWTCSAPALLKSSVGYRKLRPFTLIAMRSVRSVQFVKVMRTARACVRSCGAG